MRFGIFGVGVRVGVLGPVLDGLHARFLNGLLRNDHVLDHVGQIDDFLVVNFVGFGLTFGLRLGFEVFVLLVVVIGGIRGNVGVLGVLDGLYGEIGIIFLLVGETSVVSVKDCVSF